MATTPSTTRRRCRLAGALLVLGALLLATTPESGTGAPSAPPAARWDGVVRGDLGPLPGGADAKTEAAALAAASDVLRRHAPALGVDADRFWLDRVTRSDVGLHVRGAERRGGVAVLGTSAAVHVVGGRVWQVEARASDLAGTAADAPVDRAVAERAALGHLGLGRAAAWHVDVDRRLVPRGHGSRERLVDVWRVHVVAPTGVAATVLVAAADGRVVGVVDDRRHADGSALVFDPNPVVRLRDPSLRQPGLDGTVDTDLPSTVLDGARTRLPVREVDAAALAQGRLRGPWADVRAAAPLQGGQEPEFDLGREDPRFEAVMAYVHVDGIQRWFRDELGMLEVNAEPQSVVAVPIPGFDNSFYLGGNDVIVLGSGGVDDGEDAEVIIHEYGHAVHDAQVPGWGDHPEGGAMGEGFGDFLAAAYFARTASAGFQDRCIADWDATTYSDDDPPCLRRSDSGKRWPDDGVGQVHADGEIWSEYLWRVRERLGDDSDRTVRLVLASHTFLTTTATFADAVAALESAATALGDPGALPVVREEARRIGFTG